MRKQILTLCGFLGSGKTTLLRKLLTRYSDRKIGVLLNDFGEIPVDGTLVKNAAAPDDPILEIGGGSIFCACLKESFVKALIRLAETPAELILVEASGMADPAGIQRLLQFAQLDSDFEHLCTLCAFDPIKSYKLSHVLEVIPRQITASDAVILTKGDLCTQDEKERARTYIHSVNPAAQITEDVPDPAALADTSASESFISLGSINTPDNRPESFTLSTVNMELDGFLRRVSETPDILRVKGYLHCNGETYFVSDTGKGFDVAKCDDQPTPLTVICMRGTAESVMQRLGAHS